MTRVLLLALTLTVLLHTAAAAQDYQKEPEYLALRDSMRHAFNNGDSARFFPALKALQDYLLKQNDLHAYYTQRCNEIVFEMNRRKVVEAYMLGRKLSRELGEKHLDNEMYMAYNMLGHINRICGNKKAAKRNFYRVLDLMKKGGYYESMPPIYMNIVNVEIDDDHEEAMTLLNKAREIAEKYSPDRVFDIDTRRTLSYYTAGDIPKFLEGYKAYREGVARHEVITKIYEKAGRWKEAYESLHKSYSASDSVNNVALANSMTGIRDQLAINDMERASIRNRMIALIIGLILLALLVVALIYIVQSRRRHLTQLKNAYQHALESDKMKTSFIQNVTHEVRTPLNIISGFAQVIADPELTKSDKERQHMAEMMQKSATQITKLIDEIIGLSLIETSSTPPKEDTVNVHQIMQEAIDENRSSATKDTELRLESELPDDFCIKTNKIIVSRVISALTDNAVKYTERGSVTLRANADDKTLNIAIEDTGCGVPAEEAENIFGRFVKLDSFKEGLGLGLPLSRKLAEQIGSTVTLDTSYHPGARFVVTIPIDSSEK